MKVCLAFGLCHPASAGPWSIDPQLGVSTDYSTNPDLRTSDPVAEHHIAGIFTVPLHYDVDALDVTLTPSGRVSDSAGYTSLASNFARVNGTVNYATELDTVSVQGGVSRDTSLYETGQVAYGNGVGVRRDSTTAAADWLHYATERLQFEFNTGWSRVLYDQPADTTNLVDYRYYSANPTLIYAISERDSVKLLYGLGRYDSVNGETVSNSSNLQLGIVRQLSEIWTLTANVGYSRAKTQEKYFFYQFYLGTLESDQNGTVYAANLTRKGEQFNVTGAVSRSLQPFGSYGLSRVDSYSVSASYTLSERWVFSALAGWVQEYDPTQTTADIEVHYLNARLKVSWQATPRWIV